jgi:hypothetical protein
MLWIEIGLGRLYDIGQNGESGSRVLDEMWQDAMKMCSSTEH